MSPHERWNALLDLLAQQGSIEVDDTAAKLGVSSATIRRDLDQLARQQMLTRTRGGAVSGAVSYDLPLRYKAARHAPEKQRIAAATAELIGVGSIVGLNGGTTTTEVARAIAAKADRETTVVTNALNIANELVVRRNVKIVVVGGVVRPASYELIGPLADRVLDGLTLDCAVLGVDGIDPAHGASTANEGEANVNRLMAERAGQVVAVADSSKLGRRAFARICPVAAIDVLVTDDDAPPPMIDAFAAAGVRVIRA